jgi:hypothetical protein
MTPLISILTHAFRVLSHVVIFHPVLAIIAYGEAIQTDARREPSIYRPDIMATPSSPFYHSHS